MVEKRYALDREISVTMSTIAKLHTKLDIYIKDRKKLSWCILYYEGRMSHHMHNKHKLAQPELDKKLEYMRAELNNYKSKILLCRRDIRYFEQRLEYLRSIDRDMWDYKEAIDDVITNCDYGEESWL